MWKSIGEQVTVIAGGSNDIGLACPKDFAARGVKVVIAARNERDIEREAQHIRDSGEKRSQLLATCLCISRCSNWQTGLLRSSGELIRGFTTLGSRMHGMFKHASAEDFRRIIEVNFLGNVYGAKAVLPHLEQIRGISLAYIVLISCKNQLSVAEHGVR